jgi:hypothetical protein
MNRIDLNADLGEYRLRIPRRRSGHDARDD